MNPKIIPDNENKVSRRDFIKTSAFAVGALGMASAGGTVLSSILSGCSTTEHFDTIITNGLIYCGDGKTPVEGAIGIKDGKIKAIGEIGNMREFAYVISDMKGLHARNAIELSKAAETYKSDVVILCRKFRADAKNVISLMAMAAMYGDTLNFEINGEDEDAAAGYLEALVKVIV